MSIIESHYEELSAQRRSKAWRCELFVAEAGNRDNRDNKDTRDFE